MDRQCEESNAFVRSELINHGNIPAKLTRPVRTFNTAVVYYLKFRLVHPDNAGFYVSVGPPLLQVSN